MLNWNFGTKYIKNKSTFFKDAHYMFIEPSLQYLEDADKSKENLLDWTVALCIYPPVKKVQRFKLSAEDYKTHPAPEGDKALRDAIVKYFKNRNLTWCKDKNIFVSGSVFNIINSFYSLIKTEWDKNYTVLIPVPTFGYYISQCYHNEIKTEIFPTCKEENWKINPQKLDKYLNKHKKVKIFIFNNPVNPTGVVYNKKDVIEIAGVLKKHEIFIISDEVFYDLAFYSTKQPYSIAAVEGMKDRVMTLNGVGKTKGLSSLCLSFACMPEELIKKFPKPSLTTSISLEAQKKATIAIQDTIFNDRYKRKCIKKQLKNIKYINKKLNKLNTYLQKVYNNNETLLTFMNIPDATNVIVLSFKGIKGKFFNKKKIKTSLDLAYLLKDEGKIAIVPGEAFMIADEEMCLRISTSYSQREIKKGFKKVTKVLEKLTSKPESN